VKYLVRLYECVACGQRYPMIPYYPKAAAHGPQKDCRGEQGWREIREEHPNG
jgi:hypothetical protein